MYVYIYIYNYYYYYYYHVCLYYNYYYEFPPHLSATKRLPWLCDGQKSTGACKKKCNKQYLSLYIYIYTHIYIYIYIYVYIHTYMFIHVLISNKKKHVHWGLVGRLSCGYPQGEPLVQVFFNSGE